MQLWHPGLPHDVALFGNSYRLSLNNGLLKRVQALQWRQNYRPFITFDGSMPGWAAYTEYSKVLSPGVDIGSFKADRDFMRA